VQCEYGLLEVILELRVGLVKVPDKLGHHLWGFLCFLFVVGLLRVFLGIFLDVLVFFLELFFWDFDDAW
jgi:hypothetical protein